ncbi:phosphatidylglycerophosphate synthase, partial [Archaeoglobales archaeon ex4484_92]
MLSILKLRISKILEPLARILAEFGLQPNHLTILGLLIGLAASILISVHQIFIGAFFVLLSGICDVLDGAIARTQDMETKFGGYLDSVFDRYV